MAATTMLREVIAFTTSARTPGTHSSNSAVGLARRISIS
jgi:hypothetical protein